MCFLLFARIVGLALCAWQLTEYASRDVLIPQFLLNRQSSRRWLQIALR
jgi:hypothetical protein